MAAVSERRCAPVRQQVHWTRPHRASSRLLVVALAAAGLPGARRCSAILLQSLQDAQGRFVGLANFIAYAKTPALLESLWNSLWVSALVTLITCRRLRLRLCADAQLHAASSALFRGITLMPLLAPSLLSAISLIYWFGNQGVLKAWLQASGHRADLRRAGHRAGRDLLACSRMR